MKDERITKLAARLIHHSIQLQPKERILIRGHINTKPLLKELIDETYRVGAYPYVELEDDEISRHLLQGNVKEQLDTSITMGFEEIYGYRCGHHHHRGRKRCGND